MDVTPGPATGERRAMEARLEQLHDASFAWALQCCRGDRSEAEDLLQSVYLKILEGRARFEGRAGFKTWLFAVIRNSAMETRRRVFRKLRALNRMFNDQPSPERGFKDDLESRELRSRIGAMLDRLSGRQREVLRLVFYHDLSIEEASVVMGLTVGSARVHYERGKAKLRKGLEGFEVDYVHGERRKAHQRAV